MTAPSWLRPAVVLALLLGVSPGWAAAATWPMRQRDPSNTGRADGTTATLDWQYTGAGTSGILGDTQHLPSGHFLITNSDRGTNGGVVQEIDEHAEVIQTFAGLSAAYSCHRSTLYGPPPGR